MNWLNKLEKRFGFIAVPNAVIYVIVGQVIFTFMELNQPGVAGQMLLDPAAVASGQFWRLITFIMIPDTSPMSLLFAIFWFYFLWFMGRGLEQEWGAFKVTIYLASGLLFQIAVSMLGYYLLGLNITQSGYYWTLSIQLAFAFLYPDFTFYFFMILPVKMRWWAWFLGAMLVFRAVMGGMGEAAIIAASMGNYLIFFGPEFYSRWRGHRSSQGARQQIAESFKAAVASMPAKVCSQCGKDPQHADIRLCTCSKCGDDGKFWCTDDLPAHLGK